MPSHVPSKPGQQGVFKAQPPRYGALGSLGDAAYMYIRQSNFPAYWNPKVDVMVMADHDRCFQWDYDHSRQCCTKHMNTGELGLPEWARTASDKQIIAFLADMLKANENHPGVEWTGYRITGTVNRSNGYPVFTLELFCNRSGTEVFTGVDAPNVEMPEGFTNDGISVFFGISGRTAKSKR